MPKARRPPPGGFHIRLTVEGRELGGAFSECSGLESETDVVEYREGGDADTVLRRPGATKWSNIVLRRPLDTSRDLWDWRNAVVTGVAGTSADGTIELLDHAGRVAVTFRFRNGWPVKYSASVLAGAGTNVAVETIELSVEQLERV